MRFELIDETEGAIDKRMRKITGKVDIDCMNWASSYSSKSLGIPVCESDYSLVLFYFRFHGSLFTIRTGIGLT